jgi:ankyrin repeat protein
VLWILAKSGFTKEVAPLMNLSKATRECKNLHREMREVRNRRDRWGVTQLHYYCEKGMTSSVVRMLEMRSIDVEARVGGDYGMTCLTIAAANGHLAICRLLIDKGA